MLPSLPKDTENLRGIVYCHKWRVEGGVTIDIWDVKVGDATPPATVCGEVPCSKGICAVDISNAEVEK
jgi:hypothetical protein